MTLKLLGALRNTVWLVDGQNMYRRTCEKKRKPSRLFKVWRTWIL